MRQTLHHVTKILFTFIIISILGSSGAYASSVTYYIYDNPKRTVTSLIDENEVTVNTYKYDDFGKVHDEIEVISNSYKYNGEQNETETGLIFLRNRYYDPATGRFITKDPLTGIKENPQTLNPYVYVSNNPIRFIDPLGFGEWRRRPLGDQPYLPWLNMYHAQYFEDNGTTNYGFMNDDRVRADDRNFLSRYRSTDSRRDDATMRRARDEVKSRWDMDWGFPNNGAWYKPSRWGQCTKRGSDLEM